MGRVGWRALAEGQVRVARGARASPHRWRKDLSINRISPIRLLLRILPFVVRPLHLAQLRACRLNFPNGFINKYHQQFIHTPALQVIAKLTYLCTKLFNGVIIKLIFAMVGYNL